MQQNFVQHFLLVQFVLDSQQLSFLDYQRIPHYLLDPAVPDFLFPHFRLHHPCRDSLLDLLDFQMQRRHLSLTLAQGNLLLLDYLRIRVDLGCLGGVLTHHHHHHHRYHLCRDFPCRQHHQHHLLHCFRFVLYFQFLRYRQFPDFQHFQQHPFPPQ
jgi:hypothetical protein